MIESLRRLSLCAALCCLLGLATATVQAQTATYQFDLPGQPLADALRAVGRQTSKNILFDPALVEGISVPALRAELTVGDAVKRLLTGTKLSTQEIAPDTVLIRNGTRDAEKKAVASKTTSVQSPNGQTHLAQADAAEGGTAQREGREIESQELPAPEERGKAIPEILVRGSKSLNTDISRTEDGAQPYVVFGREEIEQSQTLNLEEFLKTRLPMNATADTNSQGAGLGNRSTINLRGLGTNQTLILVDGRRMPRASGSGSFLQADINGIPLSAVERIEVLPSTASGIHGGGATGGVVNIILRRDYRGADLRLGYGNTFDSDVASRSVDFNGGFSLEGGATRVMLAASYTDANPLLVADRDLASRARALYFENDRDGVFNAGAPPVGLTSNICNATEFFPGFGLCNPDPLVLKPEYGGTVLTSSRTFVPLGYPGIASDNGAALVANDGQYSLAIPDTISGGRSSLLNDPRVRSGLLSVRRSFGGKMEGFVDLAWLDNEGHTFNATLPENVFLSAAAPNNPFTTPIVVSFPATGLVAPVETESETLRAAAGLIVRLPRGWTAALDYAWSRARDSSFSNIELVGDPDGFSGPAVPVTMALADGTLDVMRDLNANPLDWTDYLVPTPNAINGPSDDVLKDATLRVSGPLARVPGGPITLSGSFEHREEQAQDAFFQLPTFEIVFFFPERSQTVDSYYLEANIPFISAANALPFAGGLELLASARHDEYETRSTNPGLLFGASTDGPFDEPVSVTNRLNATRYTLALRYSPVEDIVFRASRGTGFLPPSVDQLQLDFAPGAVFFNLIDPKRENAPTTMVADTTSGGNPDLQPEDSGSWSFGAVITPRWLPTLRLSLDYTRIEKTDEITSPTPQDLLTLEDLFPGRITRAPLSPADSALGYTGGAITAFDTTLINAQSSRIEAYDLQLDYGLETARFGDFRFFGVGTLQRSFERRVLPNAGPVELVGHTGGPLKWRGNVGLTWDYGPLTVSWNTQYFDSYFVYGPGSSADTIAAATRPQGSDRIPSQTYSDVLASWRFAGSGVLADTEISFGVQNVFDEIPPALASIGSFGGYSPYGDPRLRRYSVSLRTSF